MRNNRQNQEVLNDKNDLKNDNRKKKIGSVGVIITCYNLGEYLMDAINSVKEQVVKPQEIIVIDDGSSDINTINILNKLSQDDGIRLIKQKNQGVSVARNNAAKQSECDYILFLDADDMIHKDYIKYTKSALDNDNSKSLGFVTTWVNTFGLSNEIWETQDSDYDKEIIHNAISITSLMRREMFDDIGGYSDEMNLGYEDWDFWISSLERGYKWKVIKKPLFNYRVRQNSRNKKAIEKDRLLKKIIVSRHPGIYLDKIIEQDSFIDNQKNTIESLKGEINQLKDRVDSLNDDIKILNKKNSRPIVKQIIRIGDIISNILEGRLV